MGVPALFRWLSKKYPKIILPVVEEEETKMQDDHDNEIVIPTNMASPNPNGMEFDNLYLDMNGIVHPCTHPEGKPAPETEEEMMTEIFKYTERVVNMVRPRKLLFMAIDGVAPRAKMNQQRSRRFRSAQEAKEKEEAHRENIAIWEAMGKKVSEEEKVKEAWDSNAITPGTPFMDLLAQSLRYWVVQKLNTDAGWKQVIISDASVPGEGEHKIMDYIRRQRTNPGHDPNTRHVIYGLDADLIMLALATHEPHFRVLREDVFFQDTSPTACRTCGQEGHYSAQCTGVKAEVKKTPPEKKPYIFLDVTILREYLEVELDVSHSSFPFNLEQAIDDWVLLIFFVGNDFLPHLPSLEIREGAIDTLLKIWKQELPRMGGYLTNHGTIEMSRAQIILEGLAKREDDIFRRRREAEERQDQNAKRRKIEMETVKGPSASLRLTEGPTPPTSGLNPVHPSLPQRPNFNFAANADSIGLGAQRTQASVQNVPTATQALAGSNRDVVANRKAIRMANMSAAEVLKAELSGSGPVKPIASLPPKPVGTLPVVPQASRDFSMGFADSEEIPGLGGMLHEPQVSLTNTRPQDDILPEAEALLPPHGEDINADGDVDSEIIPDGDSEAVEEILVGVKRKAPEEETEVNSFEEDEADGNTTGANLALKVRPDGTAEQEDTVKLWEPGYRERYYKQKFGVELSDIEFRKSLTKSYVEGLSWVLHYYYQGTPSWQWYYPHHFAPFAADFLDVDGMDITFELGTPFKPFEQLMGVFPAASRKHIPDVFHTLMTDEDSPIIDFYPSSFEIDMNGKKMAWQGVALLPFIDPKRLLDAMNPRYPGLTEEEVIRNQWGDNVVFAADEHPVYPFYEQLYGKRKSQEPSIINPKVSKGISGSVLPNPNCLPGSTYYCPLKTQGLPDIKNDRSLSVLYYFPKQLTPHRSVMLPGVKYGTRTLLPEDLEITRNGGRGRGRGGWGDRGGGRGRGNNGPNRNGDPFHSRPNTYGSGPANGTRGYGGGGRGGSYQNSYPPRQNQNQPYSQSYSQQSYGSGYGGGRPSGNSYGGGNQYDGYGSSGGPQRGGYHGGEANGNYGGYGGYGGSSGGYNGGDNYGGYGGGGQPNWNTNDTQYGGYGSGGGYGGYGGYGNSGRGALPSRGRGRGW